MKSMKPAAVSGFPQIVYLKQREIEAERHKLAKQVREMQQSSMIFNQLKLQPKRLLQKRLHLQKQSI